MPTETKENKHSFTEISDIKVTEYRFKKNNHKLYDQENNIIMGKSGSKRKK